jgi:hypothetical protein
LMVVIGKYSLYYEKESKNPNHSPKKNVLFHKLPFIFKGN